MTHTLFFPAKLARILGELDPEGKRNILDRAEDPSSRTISRGELLAMGLNSDLTGTPLVPEGAGLAVGEANLNTGRLFLLWRGCEFGSSWVGFSVPPDLPVCLRYRADLLLIGEAKCTFLPMRLSLSKPGE